MEYASLFISKEVNLNINQLLFVSLIHIKKKHILKIEYCHSVTN